MSKNFDIGLQGEQLAVEYLLGRGFTIVARNWRAGAGQADRGEIDIIATCGSVLHFVEVKSRSNAICEGDFSPIEAFTSAKRDAVVRTAQKYISMMDYCGDTAIDLCAINFFVDGAHRLRFFDCVGSF